MVERHGGQAQDQEDEEVEEVEEEEEQEALGGQSGCESEQPEEDELWDITGRRQLQTSDTPLWLRRAKPYTMTIFSEERSLRKRNIWSFWSRSA